MMENNLIALLDQTYPGVNQAGIHEAKSVRTSKSGSPELRKALFLVMDCLIQTQASTIPLVR